MRNLVCVIRNLIIAYNSHFSIVEICKKNKNVNAFIYVLKSYIDQHIIYILGDLFNLNNKHKDILSFQNILDKYKVKFCLGDEIKFSTIEIKQKYLEWTKKIDKNVINNISKCYHHVYFFKKQDKINEIIKNFTYTEIKKLYEYAICFFMVITEIIEINSVDNIEIIIGEAIYQKEWWINAWTTISNIDFTFSKQLSFEEIFDKLDKRGKNE